MTYSGLDLSYKFIKGKNEEEDYVNVFFKNEFIFKTNHLGTNENKPSLMYYLGDDFNYYLESPFVKAGGYNNTELYDIKGNKLTNFKLWSISNPYIFNDTLYFEVTSRNGKKGIINSKGNIIIPFEYDSLSLSLTMENPIMSNGLLYVEKEKEFGVIDLKNNIIYPFTKSWNDVKIKQLKDLNLFDCKNDVVIVGEH